MKQLCLICSIFSLFILLLGCSVVSIKEKKLKDAEFQIVDKDEIPEEMKEMIKEQKKNPFRITYGDKTSLYIGRGYGEQESSGYSIEVTKCYETENTICVHTNLMGPENGEEISEKPTCPYLVIQIKWTEKQIIFD